MHYSQAVPESDASLYFAYGPTRAMWMEGSEVDSITRGITAGIAYAHHYIYRWYTLPITSLDLDRPGNLARGPVYTRGELTG